MSRCFDLEESESRRVTATTVNISFTAKLRARRAVAGSRNTAEATSLLPGHVDLGNFLAEFIRKVSRDGAGFVPEDTQESLTRELDELLVPVGRNLAVILSCTDFGPVRNDECDTDTRVGMIKRWATACRERPWCWSVRLAYLWCKRRTVCRPQGWMAHSLVQTTKKSGEEFGHEECVLDQPFQKNQHIFRTSLH